MYDMYPDDWAPARHRIPSSPEDVPADGVAAVQSALDLRDRGGPRPDDS